MPRLRKDDVADIDIDEMESAEYSNEEIESYGGKIPPTGTILTGFIKKMWWTRTAEKEDGTGEAPMIKVLWVAAENEGDMEEYDGLPVWENLVLTPYAKFRWAPCFATFGITIRDVVNKTIVATEDERNGAPIEKIGTFVPGSDEAWSRLVINKGRWNGDWRAEAKRWLPWDADEAEEPEDTEPEEPEDLEEEDLEPDEEAEPAPRGRRAVAKPAQTRAQPTTPARGRKLAAAASGTRSKPSAAKPSRGRRPTGDEPPF